MRKSNFALRLQPSIMEELRTVAKSEGVAVNQLINVAIAGMLAERRGMAYMAARAAMGRKSFPRAFEILGRAGRDNPPDPDDEWKDEWEDDELKAKAERGELRIQQGGRRREAAATAAAAPTKRRAAAARKQRKVKG